MRKRSYILFRFAFILIPLLNASCATTGSKSSDITQYLFLSEYGGYVPVVAMTSSYYKDYLQVRPDWVVPVLLKNDELNFELPSSQNIAEERVRDRESKERMTTIAGNMTGIALSPILVPMFMLSEPFYHSNLSRKSENIAEQFEKFGGVKVNIQVVDHNGASISRALISEVVWPIFYPVYSDEAGHRSFHPPHYNLYFPKDSLIELMAEHLPIHMGRSIELSQSSWCIAGSPDYFQPLKGAAVFNHSVDENGSVIFTSNAFIHFAKFSERSEWQWSQTPQDLTFHFIVWSPGYYPAIYSVKAVKPATNLKFKIILEQLLNAEKIQNLHKEFNAIIENTFGKAKEPILIHSKKQLISDSIVKPYIKVLSSWIKDQSLPTYFRWNVYKLFVSIKELTGIFGMNVSQEARYLLEQSENVTKSLSPYLSDSQANPWKAAEAYDNWMRGVREGYKLQKVDENKTIHELISMWNAVDQNDPKYNNIRAALFISKGDKDGAKKLTKYMDHSAYIPLFYGRNFEVIEPQTPKGYNIRLE